MTNETETETLSLPEASYHAGMECLVRAEKQDPDSQARTNYLLEAIAHAMLGGLRDGLDYISRNSTPPPVPSGPLFEEDDDRP